jgi:dihydrofolate reductase
MMRSVVFYGAISVDGYIAREDHALDWLIGTEGEEEAGYEAFYDTVDTIIMGRKTYEQIGILSPDEFPYAGKECYVFSRANKTSNEHVTFINDDIVEFVTTLKGKRGNRIWVVGGGELLQPLLEQNVIDEYYIQVAPSILGKGIPLFKSGDYECKLELVDVRRYKQLAELCYKKRTSL